MSKSPCVHTCVNKGRKELSQPSEKAHQLPDVDAPLDPGRRSFLAKAGAAATVTLATGNPADFANITMGGTNLLTNPQSGLAFDLEGTDGHNPTVPAAPTVAGTQTAAEIVELYWASLLRDVPFDQYPGNSIAVAAAKELTNFPDYTGPRNNFHVTANLLFRGGLGSTFAGETEG